MSDTPRTDARLIEVYLPSGVIHKSDHVQAHFARQLERELAEAQEALQSLIEAMTFTDYANGYSKYIVILGDDEIDALRKAARLENEQ
jgi:hypothetical protein